MDTQRNILLSRQTAGTFYMLYPLYYYYYYYYYIIIIINFYVRMYEYDLFSPHNGIATGNILILLFSPINDNFNFYMELLLMYSYTDCLILYFVCYFFVSFYVLVLTF
jgi:hypothetical protein